MRRLAASLALVFVLGASAVQVFGQGGATGAISGVVQDPSGAVVPNAEVRVVNQQTGVLARTLTTDSNGAFAAQLLPVGVYTLSVKSSGFAEETFSDVDVRITETARITAKLRPEAQQQKVEVHAEVLQVETSTASTGQAIESQTIRNLPLATQNFQQLLTLSTGAQDELNASTQLGRGNVRIYVNGQREDNNNYLIEGISATDYNVAELTTTPLPNPDVIEEFKVQTSLYDSSQGRNGGGNINAILKSGTKTFHGDVYEFFRNTALDANEYFLKENQLENGEANTRPVIQQNIFGGSLGGPIGPGARLGFFFANYQATRQRSGDSAGAIISTSIPIVPASLRSLPAAELATALGVSSIDPVAYALLQAKSTQFGAPANGYLYPALTGNPLTGTGQTNFGSFAVSEPGKYTDNQFTANWDREFRNSNDKISARFFYTNFEQDLPFGAGGLQASLGAAASPSDLNFPYEIPVHDRFFSLSETHLFSPTLVNDFRVGYVRINNSGINVDPVTAADVGIDRPTNNLTNSIYKFTFETSGFQFGPTPPANQYQVQNNFDLVETLSWVHGHHSWRFGAEFTPVNLNKKFPQVFNGQLFFTNTSGPSLSDFQNFLEGAPQFSFGGGGVYNHAYRQKNYAAFAQDDWKVFPSLTVNLGLRTEFLGAWKDNDCHIGNIESSLTLSGTFPFIYPSCVNKLGVAGLHGTAAGSTFGNSVATGIGPRIGFAWDVGGKHNTTLRAGYGIYYVREDVGAVDQLSFQAPFLPIAFDGGAPGSLANFFSGSPATNPNALPPAGVLSATYLPCLAQLTSFPDTNGAATYGGCTGPGTDTTQNLFVLEVPHHFQVPSTQQWNLTLQRELGKQWILEIGYVGTKGTHLRNTRDAIQSLDASPSNPVVVKDVDGNSYSITANTFDNAIARTPTPGLNGYSGYQIFANDAYSIYHSLQTTLSRRWSHNYVQIAYTLSKNIDATSSGNTAFNTAYNSETTVDASRGLSDFDRPDRLTVSYVYDLPVFTHGSGFAPRALGGWSISGVTTVQSGTPFSIIDSSAGTAFLGQGSAPLVGASLTPGFSISQGYATGDIHQRVNGYLNPAAFTPAPLLYPAQCASDPNFCTTDFGNLGRNIYRGPYEQNWDLSFIKHFKLGERYDLRFTADFFNAWNHTNFANPAVTDIETYVANPTSSSPFGKIVSTEGNPRLIQFSLRWAF
jgi:Carboxypeptidase regulatory-like domain